MAEGGIESLHRAFERRPEITVPDSDPFYEEVRKGLGDSRLKEADIGDGTLRLSLDEYEEAVGKSLRPGQRAMSTSSRDRLAPSEASRRSEFGERVKRYKGDYPTYYERTGLDPMVARGWLGKISSRWITEGEAPVAPRSAYGGSKTMDDPSGSNIPESLYQTGRAEIGGGHVQQRDVEVLQGPAGYDEAAGERSDPSLRRGMDAARQQRARDTGSYIGPDRDPGTFVAPPSPEQRRNDQIATDWARKLEIVSRVHPGVTQDPMALRLAAETWVALSKEGKLGKSLYPPPWIYEYLPGGFVAMPIDEQQAMQEWMTRFSEQADSAIQSQPKEGLYGLEKVMKRTASGDRMRAGQK
jgi:hypothetical protein